MKILVAKNFLNIDISENLSEKFLEKLCIVFLIDFRWSFYHESFLAILIIFKVNFGVILFLFGTH